jgi:hypothetical protein
VSHPNEGRCARHERCGGMRWTRQRRARKWDRRADLPVSDQPARGRTTLLPVLAELCPDRTRSSEDFGGDGRGRRSCVVLAPRCWRQVFRRCIRPTGLVASRIREATVARKPVTGERKVSRNPSRRESRFDPVEPVVTSCASCAHDRGCNRHPAFPAPSVLGGGWRSKPRALGAAGNADPHPQDEATRGRRVEGVGWRCRIDTFVASRPQFLNI